MAVNVVKYASWLQQSNDSVIAALYAGFLEKCHVHSGSTSVGSHIYSSKVYNIYVAKKY